MSEDRLEEILVRLEALEQKLQSAPAPTVAAEPEEAPDEGDPDEKRRIDLIVRLVTENVDQLLRQRLAELVPPAVDEGRLADRCAERVRQNVYDLFIDDLQGPEGGRNGGHHHRHGSGHGEGWRHGPGGRGPKDMGPRDMGPRDTGPRDRGPGPWEGGERR